MAPSSYRGRPKTGSAAPGVEEALTVERIRWAFAGRIEPVRVSLPYRVGLLLVAVAMVLLPMAYVGLIALVVWAIGLQLSATAWTVGGVWGLLLYLTPIVAGWILVVFMLKPLVARKSKGPKLRSLDPAADPLMFAFVREIASAVRAPQPRRIDVNCETNANASFRRGVWSFLGHDLLLTIGLPMVAGLSLAHLAGVLAHELAHFSQGAGMRLTYVIRSVNNWFARIVYERDAWDEKLTAWSERSSLWIGLPLYVARLFVWLTRRVLWVLMYAGHAISCFMLRQMEYDADRYEARLAGSDAFEATARRIALLSVAESVTHEDLHASWQERRLCDNLPAMIARRMAVLPAEALDGVEEFLRENRTGPWDTHPGARDRIRNAHAEQAEGVWRLARPATDLFADFDALAQQATLAFYHHVIGPEVTRDNLVATAKLLKDQQDMEGDWKVQARYFQGLLSPLVPLFVDPAAVRSARDAQAAEQAVRQGWARTLATAPSAREALEKYGAGDELLRRARLAGALLEMGFTLDHREFALPAATTGGAREAQQHAEALQRTAREELRPALEAARSRLGGAFQLLAGGQMAERIEGADALIPEMQQLLAAQAWLADVCDEVDVLRVRHLMLRVLTGNLEANQGSAPLLKWIESEMLEIHRGMQELRERLGRAAYPFEHAEGEVSIGRYALDDLPDEYDLEAVLAAGEEMLDRLYMLYFRIMGRLAAIAEAVESALGLARLPDPPAEQTPPEPP